MLTALIFALCCYGHAFLSNTPQVRHSRLNALTVSPVVQDKVVTSMNDVYAPDFYWKFRLDRLVSMKGSDLAFSEGNYPEVKGFKDLYDSYYLDLALQNKLGDFDWEADKHISDTDWQKIFKSICTWSSKVSTKYKFDTSTLPANDFDLIKMLYPNYNMREFEEPLKAEEYGDDFPYMNLKELYSAARRGTLAVPGYAPATVGNTILDASEARQALAELKERTFAKLDATLEECRALIENPFPDETARRHYQALRDKLATLPQNEEEWRMYRERRMQLVEEMTLVASRRVPEAEQHHHEHEEGHGGHSATPPAPTPAEEFQAKYGKSLEVLAQDFAKFKANPSGYLEALLQERVGKSAHAVWKRTKELQSAQFQGMEADMARELKEVISSA